MQVNFREKFKEREMKQIEISAEIHKSLKLEAADREMPIKSLANDVLEGWLDSHRPGWRQSNGESKEGGDSVPGK